ncbi:CDP-alcohol phosphatidyltransferase family protein [Litorimonas sp. RW-G-Af-16]|uniref:CDP-alcohol phosphatidyltransferase family protein n=1 Tax=Litorimonas sp. RW-G-Af-16 TaxID=3241168 RepID=UPI00390C4A2C
MTTSTNNAGTNKTGTNNTDAISTADAGGAFADGLTLVRILLTPVVMFLIYRAWTPTGIDTTLTALASFLFAIAAISDIIDDFLGGSAKSAFRKFGYLDDIADTVLVVGTLLALLFVVHRAGILAWPFTVPAVILIGREVIVGLLKGFELHRFGWPDNVLSSAKTGFAMLGTCLLLASPWLTQWVDMARANEDNVMQIFNSNSPMIWIVGQVVLWIAALFSILSAIKIFRANLGPANEA